MAFTLAEIFGKGKAPVQKETEPKIGPDEPGIGKSPQSKHETAIHKSPVELFEDLFKMEEPTEEQKKQQKADPNAPYFSIDPAKLNEQVSKINFVGDDPEFDEDASAALGGDVAAFKKILNRVAQKSYSSGAEFSTNVANRVTKTGFERNSADLPAQLRDLLSEDAVTSANETFNHPGMKPIVNALRQQVLTKYPNATPKEISTKTAELFAALGEIAGGTKQTTQAKPQGTQQQVPGQTDFSNFFK